MWLGYNFFPASCQETRERFSNSTSFCELHPTGPGGVCVKPKHFHMHLNVCSKWESGGCLQCLWPHPAENGTRFGGSLGHRWLRWAVMQRPPTGRSSTLTPMPVLSEDRGGKCLSLGWSASSSPPPSWPSAAKPFFKVTWGDRLRFLINSQAGTQPTVCSSEVV